MSNEVISLFPTRAPVPAGREGELAALLREHDEAKSSGRTRVVFVRGPRGVGKSHLTHAVGEALAQRGTPVFHGGASRDGRRTWGLFGPLLRELLTFATRLGVPQDRVAALARALEPVTRGRSDAQAEANRLAVYDAAAELLGLVSRSAPLVVLPDLDVADRASLELVRYLLAVQASPEARGGALIVLSLRDDEVLPEAVEEIVSRVSGRTLALGGLNLDGIRAFLAREDVAERLMAVTLGNPEALGALLDRPLGAVDFFVKRVERLDEPSRAALSVLSVTQGALTVDVLAAALGQTVDRAAATVDALGRERLVSAVVVEGRAAYRFAREGEQRALFAHLSAAQVAQLKTDLGSAMAEAGLSLSAAELLLDAGAPAAFTVALEAARTLVQRGALEDAAGLFARMTPPVEVDAQALWHEEHGRILSSLGAYARSARRLLAAARLGQPSKRAALWLDASRMLLKVGRLDAARALVSRCEVDPSTESASRAVCAELMLAAGEATGAEATCRAALAGGVSGADAVAVQNVLGKVLLVQGRASDAEAVFAAAVASAEQQGLSQAAALARLNEGVAAFKRGDRDRALVCWKATPSGHRPAHAQAQANLGSAYAESGDFDAALEHLGQALSAFTRFAGHREVSMAANNLARVCLFLGDLERAESLAQHALDRGHAAREPYLEAGAKLTLGAAALEGRRSQEALGLLEAARLGFERLGNDGFAALACAYKARLHLEAGERAQAEVELARRCVERGAGQLPSALVEVELTRAELQLVLGDLHGAARATSRLREALLDKPDLEAPVRTYFVSGLLKQQAGDIAAAQAEFQRAGRVLDELVARVPAVRREAFLSLPRRAQVVAKVEPELRLPRALRALETRAPVSARHGLVGRSMSLGVIVKQLEPVGRSNTTVLVRGESGTGKELLADALHDLSPRKGMPLVKVNCAAMVEELLLSELFGHEKGAFTGAVRERKGRFEMADGGTIFLDEIGDISPKAQVALLRVLQEREFERVGGSKTLKVDVRIICATNRDLEALIAQGRFRADLYYRLKGVTLVLPPLRERLDDLPALAQHFLDKATRDRGEAPRRLTDAAHALLARHAWPGNVRELENVVASAAIFAEGSLIDVEAFSHVAELKALMTVGEGQIAAPTAVAVPPVSVAASAPVAAEPVSRSASGALDYYELARSRGLSLKDLRNEIELQCIKRALVEAGGNISEAARLLMMKRSRLSQIVNAEPELREVARGDA